jgi:sec-independent protein translocase protein TatC
MNNFDKTINFLIESKVRVFASFMVVLMAVIFCFCISNNLIKALELKIPYQVTMLQLYVPEIFFNNLKIGLFAGLFVSAPLLIYQFAKLKIKEMNLEKKKTLVKITSVLFGVSLLAILAAYFFFIPLQLVFFLGINHELSNLTLNLSSYISFCLATMFVSCLVFFVPVFYYLIKKNLFFSSKDLESLKKIMLYVSLGLSLLILSPPELVEFVIFAFVIHLFYVLMIYLTRRYGKKNGL